MAGRNSTAAPQHACNRPTVAQLIDIIESYADGLHHQGDETLAIAIAAEVWAGQRNPEGDKIDVTAALIFGAIRKLNEDASNYLALVDNLNELRDLLAMAGLNGGAQ